MSKTQSASNNLLDHEFRGQAFTAIGTLTMKLSTTQELTGDGTDLTPVGEPGYAGVPLTPATYFTSAATGGAIVLAIDAGTAINQIEFGTNTGATYTIKAVYWEDEATGGAGIVRYKNIGDIPINNQQQPVIPDGGMTIQEA